MDKRIQGALAIRVSIYNEDNALWLCLVINEINVSGNCFCNIWNKKENYGNVIYVGWFVPFRIFLFGGRKCERRHAKTRQMVTFSCFRTATFRPATPKYATFHALRFRLLFVVSLPCEAKSRHEKTRQNHLLAGLPQATFRVFAPKTRLYDMA